MQSWLKEFIRSHREMNDLLIGMGAPGPVPVRERLLEQLEEAAHAADFEHIPLLEAAERAGVHPETARRAIRSGELTDVRERPGQHMSVLRGELDILRAKGRGIDKDEQSSYDTGVTDISSKMR